jgi:beta-glucosidase
LIDYLIPGSSYDRIESSKLELQEQGFSRVEPGKQEMKQEGMCIMKFELMYCLFSLSVIFIALTIYAEEKPLYMNSSADIEARIEDLLNRMTLEEKADMLGGTGFDSKPNDRLGIPALKMTDGPVGVRSGEATAFPVSVAMAASWDTELMEEVGSALGREAKAKDKNVLLGPCICIHRVPHGGRNFESFGEDPYLTAKIAVAYIQGLQKENVIATAKHYCLNSQEFERHSIDVKIDERTLHEIYLPAFKAAVQQGPCWAIMSAYNRINGHYASSNTYLLTDILKKRWGFKGFVMSDWGAVHSIVPTLYAGLDIEMPRGKYLKKENVLQALEQGRMKESKVDDKVRRMLRAMFSIGLFDKEPDKGALDTEEHRQLALKLAQNSMVLLKNENALLPIEKDKVKSVALIGPNAAEARTGGGGSSKVTPFYEVSPLEGLKNRLGNTLDIRYAQGVIEGPQLEIIPSRYLRPPAHAVKAFGLKEGLLGEYFNNNNLSGEPCVRQIDPEIDFYVREGGVHDSIGVDNFSIRWTGQLVPEKSGQYILAITSDDGSRLYLDGELKIDNWGPHAMELKSDTLMLEAGKTYEIRVDYCEYAGYAALKLSWLYMDPDEIMTAEEKALHEALMLAKESDFTVVCVGGDHRYETETRDRRDLNLPAGHDKLIEAVARVNPNTVVVINSGASVNMPWLDQVHTVIQVWYPGQEGGNALADILLGNVNPSGKLPTTFIHKWEDSPAYGNYPGENDEVYYKEGIFVGYRYFASSDTKPMFPFGYGLSYTTFEYDNIKINKKSVEKSEQVVISLSVKNTGPCAGAEVVQLYVSDVEASVPRPKKELKGFKKVFLEPGQKETIRFSLNESNLAFYDIKTQNWIAEQGKFEVLLGSSSEDIRLKESFDFKNKD